MDNSTLNAYYSEEVQMSRDETTRNTKIVLPIVNEILKYVHARDKRFRRQTFDVGSYHTHLKVSRADEFDFSVVMDMPQLSWVEGKKRYYGFNEQKDVVKTYIALPNPPPGKCFVTLGSTTIREWERQGLNQGLGCLTIDEDIIPIKVKRHFKRLVHEAVKQPKFYSTVSVSKITESPATKLSIDHPDIGYTINVDLCPMIDCKVEFLHSFGFPRYNKQFPPMEKISEIRKLGVNLIAKEAFYWTLSFAVNEKELLKEIDKDGGCRRKCQRIIKKLKEDFWCPKGMKQELTSYHLKNTLFWECEDHPYTKDWVPDMLSIRVRSMTVRLLGYLQRRVLPLYFHTQVNLLETKDKEVIAMVAGNIYKFLQDTMVKLE